MIHTASSYVLCQRMPCFQYKLSIIAAWEFQLQQNQDLNNLILTCRMNKMWLSFGSFVKVLGFTTWCKCSSLILPALQSPAEEHWTLHCFIFLTVEDTLGVKDVEHPPPPPHFPLHCSKNIYFFQIVIGFFEINDIWCVALGSHAHE